LQQARYYDPVTGQFLTVDPNVNTTLSPYGYVAGDPLNSGDPSGLTTDNEDDAVTDTPELFGEELLFDAEYGPEIAQQEAGARAEAKEVEAEGVNGLGPREEAASTGLAMFENGELSYSDSAMEHFATRPYMGLPSVTQMILEGGVEDAPPVVDPPGVPDTWQWSASGTYNGSYGTYRLIINLKTGVIYHFGFVSNALTSAWESSCGLGG
jgi:uncharacterized protein RhaS with RHS repeats